MPRVFKRVKARFVWRKLRRVEEDGEWWSEVADEQEIIIEAMSPLELYGKIKEMVEEMQKEGYVLHAQGFIFDE